MGIRFLTGIRIAMENKNQDLVKNIQARSGKKYSVRV